MCVLVWYVFLRGLYPLIFSFRLLSVRLSLRYNYLFQTWCWFGMFVKRPLSVYWYMVSKTFGLLSLSAALVLTPSSGCVFPPLSWSILAFGMSLRQSGGEASWGSFILTLFSGPDALVRTVPGSACLKNSQMGRLLLRYLLALFFRAMCL